MAKRTREVYPTDQIAHLWAHQTQRSARNPTGNFSFAGNELRSYSTTIAQRVEYKGRIAFLHLDQSWSNTTAKHQGHMRHASFGSTFLVQTFPLMPDYINRYYFDEEAKRGARKVARSHHNMNIDSLVKQAEQWAVKASRARTHGEWHTQSADRFLTMAKEYAAFFGIRRTFPAIDVAALATDAKARADRARKLESARAKATRERDEKIREMCAVEAPALMQQWRNTGATWLEVSPTLAELSGNRGASASNLQHYNGGSHLMRLEGENVQTNLNVRVPASHVRRLAPLALAAFESPALAEKLIGRHVGTFTINAIANGMLQVGCHCFSREEIALILDQLQRAEIVPAEETATA
jgi:hypothetical protein